MIRLRKAPCMACPFVPDSPAAGWHGFHPSELDHIRNEIRDPDGIWQCHMMPRKECFGFTAFRSGECRPRPVDHPALAGTIDELKE